MRFSSCALSFICLLVLAFSALGCNTLNPLCASARPAPVIGALTPSTVSFSQIQSGTTVTITGSNFVGATQVLVNSKPLSATVISPTKLTLKLNTGEISGPGQVKIAVETPSGNTADLGCTSGGKSSSLTLTVN
jgi:IPT/TIG domain